MVNLINHPRPTQGSNPLGNCSGWQSKLTVLNDWKSLKDPAFEKVDLGLFICSTTGNGDAPENSEKFWRFIKRRTHPKNMLSILNYSVLVSLILFFSPEQRTHSITQCGSSLSIGVAGTWRH